MQNSPELFVFIMAGGSGERFWPLSRREIPKQLLCLFSDKPLLGETLERVKGLAAADHTFILTNHQQRHATLQALPDFPAQQLIAEPAKRDTAPAAALATAIAHAQNPNAVVILLPADHLIKNISAFRQNLLDAARQAAESENLVTIAIRPSHSSTAYGYLKLSPASHQAKANATIFHQVERFVEKPALATAKEYLASGQYAWNAGMFAWRASVFYKEAQSLAPELASFIEKFPANREDATAYITECFPSLPKISVDYAIMEKASSVIAAQSEFDWDDVGSWSSLATHLPQDANGNTVRGDAVLHEASNNIVVSGGRHIALCGVDNLVVVEVGDTVLVCHRDQVQNVKNLLPHLPEKLL
ncbi:MAG: NTP transferase domain-containing protein [Verrucomicrobiales bacterium]|nr:NTP transferase domain-containing protein [Verrucomicrobiales bacterium]